MGNRWEEKGKKKASISLLKFFNSLHYTHFSVNHTETLVETNFFFQKKKKRKKTKNRKEKNRTIEESRDSSHYVEKRKKQQIANSYVSSYVHTHIDTMIIRYPDKCMGVLSHDPVIVYVNGM